MITIQGKNEEGGGFIYGGVVLEVKIVTVKHL